MDIPSQNCVPYSIAHGMLEQGVQKPVHIPALILIALNTLSVLNSSEI